MSNNNIHCMLYRLIKAVEMSAHSEENQKKIKVLQALRNAPPLHLYQASATNLSQIKSKGRCFSLSLNIINIDT